MKYLVEVTRFWKNGDKTVTYYGRSDEKVSIVTSYGIKKELTDHRIALYGYKTKKGAENSDIMKRWNVPPHCTATVVEVNG